MTKPLLGFLKNELFFEWKHEQQKAFKDLKEKLSFALVPKFQNFIKALKVHIDVSDFAIRRVFMQKGQFNCFQEQKHLWNTITMANSCMLLKNLATLFGDT